ncbi:hypothetical protein BDR26DRAFT_1008171 [Obelidium mucronatum]|nr:hypothetical protein BDR26DRAFT_1008171 [Obelidium mucronatum]
MENIYIAIPDELASARNLEESWDTYLSKVKALIHVCDAALRVSTADNQPKLERIKAELKKKKRSKLSPARMNTCLILLVPTFAAKRSFEAEKTRVEAVRQAVIHIVSDSNKNLADILAVQTGTHQSQKQKLADIRLSSPDSPLARKRVVSEAGSLREYNTRLTAISSDTSSSSACNRDDTELRPYTRETMKPVDQAATVTTARASFELAMNMESNGLVGRTNKISDDVSECSRFINTSIGKAVLKNAVHGRNFAAHPERERHSCANDFLASTVQCCFALGSHLLAGDVDCRQLLNENSGHDSSRELYIYGALPVKKKFEVQVANLGVLPYTVLEDSFEALVRVALDELLIFCDEEGMVLTRRTMSGALTALKTNIKTLFPGDSIRMFGVSNAKHIESRIRNLMDRVEFSIQLKPPAMISLPWAVQLFSKDFFL